jgi:hypothetical protein
VPPFAVPLPDFVQDGAPLIAGLALALSWIAAHVFLRAVALRRHARRGLYLGLGATHGVVLVGLIALIVSR